MHQNLKYFHSNFFIKAILPLYRYNNVKFLIISVRERRQGEPIRCRADWRGGVRMMEQLISNRSAPGGQARKP